MYAKSGVDLTSRILHQTNVTGFSPEVVSLSEDSLLASCENKLGILWLDMPLPDLFSGCFRTKPPPLCFKFISKTPHQSQQWQHARRFVDVTPLNVGPRLTDRTNPLVYQSLNGRRQPGGICPNVFKEVEIPHQ